MRDLPLMRVFQMRVIDFDVLDALAAKWMRERKAHLMREKGFIYKHGKRVAVGVIALRERVTGDDGHDDALRVAGLFHDIGKGIEPHGESGAALVRAMLQEHLPEALLSEVEELIASHEKRGATGLFLNVLQDADIIDHFGATEIIMSSQYGAYDELGIETTRDWYRTEFEPYVARSRKLLHFDVSRAILDEKAAYTRAFARRLEIEAGGAYVDGSA